MKTILTAKDITKKYRDNVLNGISFEIQESTFTVLLGHSGSGKSTLLNILSGQLRPSSGSVEYKGNNIFSLSNSQLADWKRSQMGNVFQGYLLLDNLTVEENVKIGICPNQASLDFNHLIKMLEIQDLLSRFPSELSGGQQQRVAIARAVIKNPRLLFCDEATGSLDESNSKKVITLLHQLKTCFGVAVLFTTHNQQIAKTADRIITIKDGLLSHDVHNDNPITADEMIWG